MAIQQVQNLPAQFVQDLGQDLAKQVTAQSGVPVVSTGIAGISQQPGESAADFAARQSAAQQFTTRQQSLSGLAPQVAGQDALQTQAQNLATQGVGSFQPFLQQAQTAGTAAGTALGGVGLGATAFQQGVQDFMSPYQSQVIDATLSEFDRNTQIQQQRISESAIANNAFGGSREGVMQAEYQAGSDMDRATLQAQLLNQGFQQSQQAAQQQFQNQMGLASALPGLQGTDISRLGSLGALNQAQTQAGYDATREANRMAAYQPQEQLQNYGNLVTGIMGGMQGSGTRQSQVSDPSFLQTALGAAATGAGIYGALK